MDVPLKAHTRRRLYENVSTCLLFLLTGYTKASDGQVNLHKAKTTIEMDGTIPIGCAS